MILMGTFSMRPLKIQFFFLMENAASSQGTRPSIACGLGELPGFQVTAAAVPAGSPGSAGRSRRNIAGWLTQPDVTGLSAEQSRLVFVAAATTMAAELSRVSKQ